MSSEKGYVGSEEIFSDTECITALLTHPSIKLAAASIGCSTKTLQRRMSNPEFALEFEEARMAGLELTVARFQTGMADAVTFAQNTMNDKTLPQSERMAGCKTMLQYGLAFTDLWDIRLKGLDADTT